MSYREACGFTQESDNLSFTTDIDADFAAFSDYVLSGE